MNYRKIFHNDRVSFGEMQVYPFAKEYIDTPDKLENIWVYDDEFVKGMIHIDGTQIYERHGFVLTGDKQLQEGITEFIVLMKL